jgi:pimeloyl-ACP methyl ester carboxylesterase
MKSPALFAFLLAASFSLAGHASILGPGDGSDEPGFVSPPADAMQPPAPPAHISSAETLIPYPGPPVFPQSRTEKKMPPKPPVMFTKISSDRGMVDWNARPNDLNNLLKSMKQLINVDFSMEIKSIDQISPDPSKNPILYRSGHFHFAFTPQERENLRAYLLNGGMIIFNPGMGSKPFYDSAIQEMQAIFPELAVKRIGPNHPIFHAYYDLASVTYRSGVRAAGYQGDEPDFMGVEVNCRAVAVVSRWGMDIGWDATSDDSLLGYSVPSAQQLGVNLLSYATSERAWARNATRSMQFVDDSKGTGSKILLTQVIYTGEWKTRAQGLSVLLRQFNHRTGVPVQFERRELRLTDPKLADSPVLYMHGHEDFVLAPDEAAALREYLKNGGFLMAEACCGRQDFTNAFVREMRKVLPGQSLEPVSPESPLYSIPNKIAQVGVTPALEAKIGQPAMAPKLLGIQQNGHYSVVFSPYGLIAGWEMSPDPYSLSLDTSGALALGENLLMYAVTQ